MARRAANIFVRDPREILAQRTAMGLGLSCGAGIKEGNQYLERALKRVVSNNSLSRREAQVRSVVLKD